MKTFKLIDSLISAVLIITAISITLINGNYWNLYWYFIIGGWQIISMIIHEINHWFVPEGNIRRLYHRVVAWIFVILVAWLGIGGGISATFGLYVVLYLYLLLVFTPFMAILYTVLCFMEWKNAHAKPMAKLKY